MKPHFARTVTFLALLLCLLAPAALHAQGPGGPPHPGPGSPGAPGGLPPAAPSGAPASGVGAHSHDPAQMHSGARSSTQFGRAGRWWDDKSVIRAIGITHDQQHKMDGIFDSNKSAILSSYKTFLKEQSHLESINKDTHADQAATFAAIDAVNNARAALQKATAQMLLEIRRQMSQDQIDKLEKLP